MRIVDIIREDLILPEIHATTKNGIVEELSRHIAACVPEISHADLTQTLLDREALASTAIGEGIAIPHGKLAGLSGIIACLGRIPEGVDFDSMDGLPTHLFFVLVAPEKSTGVHLKALARISRVFKEPEFRTRLLGAKTATEMYKVIADEDAKY